jgi:hypothetical protein
MQPTTLEGFRLSPQQKRIWQLLDGETSGPYNAACQVVVEGKLESGLLQIALQRLIARYEILRTHFTLLNSSSLPLQMISEQGRLTYEERDIQHLADAEQTTLLLSLFTEMLATRFDLNSDPPLRCQLLQIQPRRSILLFALPALCADTVSLQCLVQTLFEIYSALEQPLDQITEETNQYADLAEWQNSLLEDEDAYEGRLYWEKRPRATLASKFPLEQSAPSNSLFLPQRYSWQIHSSTVQRIDELVATGNISRSILSLTCWQILLWRIQNTPEVVIGYHFPGRKYEELTRSLGLFSKFLPFVSPLHAQLTAQDVLHVNARLIEELETWEEFFNPTHHFLAEDTSLCWPAGFLYETFAGPELISSREDLRFSFTELVSYYDRCKLALQVQEQGTDLSCTLIYDRSFYDPETIAALAEAYETLLLGLLKNAHTPVDALPLVGHEETHLLLEVFNQPVQDDAQDLCFPGLFTAQAQRTPARPAVLCGDEMLTYEALDRRANQVGAYLRQRGIGAESVVGVCVERSVELIIAILGIWKAGGAYLPLDPSAPEQRLSLLLQASGARILLTQTPLLEKLNNLPADVISLASELIIQASSAPLLDYTHPQNLAYCIYTSGSTGTPKGVMITHRSPLNLLRGLRQQVYQELAEEHLQVSLNAPAMFDASIQQIVQLLDGHTLVIIPDALRTDSKVFVDYLRRNRLDVLDCTPSHLKMLIAQGLLSRDVAPRLLLVAGEAIDEPLWRQLAEAAPLMPRSNVLLLRGLFLPLASR